MAKKIAKPSRADENGQSPEPSLVTWGVAAEAGEVLWLWPGGIPAGYMTLLEGRKSVGKSCLAAAIAACLTGGPELPGWTGPRRGRVLWLAAEDDWKNVTLARLNAARARVGSVGRWEVRTPSGRLRRPVLPDDLSLLEWEVEQRGISLLVLDPVISVVSPALNINVPQQCRQFTDALQEVCTRTGLSCLLLRHLRKDATGDPREAGLGGVELANAARSLLRCDEHPHEEGRFVLSSVACNYGQQWRTLVYSFRVRPSGPPSMEWHGCVDLDTEAIMEGRGTEADRDEWHDADQFLVSRIQAGTRRIRELERLAAEAGITPRMLRRAKARLKIRTTQHQAGADHWWEWSPPTAGWPSYLGEGGGVPPMGAPGAPGGVRRPKDTPKSPEKKARRPRRPRIGGTPPQAPQNQEVNSHAD